MRKFMRGLAVLALAASTTVAFSGSADAVSKKKLFLMTMRAEGLPADSTTLGIAKSFCKLADQMGVKSAMVATATAAVATGVDVEDAGYIVGAGTAAFCTRHLPALERLAG